MPVVVKSQALELPKAKPTVPVETRFRSPVFAKANEGNSRHSD